MNKRKVIWSSPVWGMTMYEPTEKAGTNPCLKCYLREVCDPDDCGRKIGKLFTK